MYKDKDKQREAQREWVRQKRAEQSPKEFKVRAEGTFEGSTEQGSTDSLEQPSPLEVVESFASDGAVIDSPKRGKDIKCFADLHPGIQRSIDMMSMVDGKIDKTIKANRTVIAISYQHRFPDRYYPQDAVCTGIVIGKPGDEDWRAERGR